MDIKTTKNKLIINTETEIIKIQAHKMKSAYTGHYYYYFNVSDIPANIKELLAVYGAISGDISYLHRAVYSLANKENIRGYEIHHRDYNTSNNKPYNLQKLTKAEHQQIHKNRKEIEPLFISLEDPEPQEPKTRKKRLTNYKKNKIKTLLKQGFTYSAIAKKCKTSFTTIKKILTELTSQKPPSDWHADIKKVALSVANRIKKLKTFICKSFKPTEKPQNIIKTVYNKYTYISTPDIIDTA